MSSVLHIRDVRQHDGCPAAHVHRSCAVGVGSVPTLNALEDRLRRPVRFGDVSAVGVLPARVARVNEQHGHPHPFRLVLDKGTKLPKGPARELGALSPSSPHPQAYAPEVFQGDSSLRAFGKPNKLFADYVVSVGRKASLLAGELLEAASRGMGALLLKLAPESAMGMSDGVDRTTATNVSVRVRSYVPNSEVNADDTFGHEWLRVLNLAGGEQVELATSVHKVRFANTGFEKLHLPLSGHEWDALPSFTWTFTRLRHGPNGDRRLAQVPGKDTVIVGDRTMRFEPSLAPLVESVGISNFGETADDYLSGETEIFLTEW